MSRQRRWTMSTFEPAISLHSRGASRANVFTHSLRDFGAAWGIYTPEAMKAFLYRPRRGPSPNFAKLLEGRTSNEMRVAAREWLDRSAAFRRRWSEAHKGKRFSAVHRNRIAAAKQGKPRSPETRARISAALQGRPASARTLEVFAQRADAVSGKPMPRRTRKRIAAARRGQPSQLRGRTMPAEHRERISDSMVEYWYKVKVGLLAVFALRDMVHVTPATAGTKRPSRGMVSSVLESASKREELALVRGAINRLPERQRNLVREFFYSGDPLPRVAARLRLDRLDARELLNAALSTLRKDKQLRRLVA